MSLTALAVNRVAGLLNRGAGGGSSALSVSWPGGLTPDMQQSLANYGQGARAFSQNEIVYAAVNLLATSAAEPRIVGRRRMRSKGEISAQMRTWSSFGIPNRAGARQRDAMLVMNGLVADVSEHPLVTLLNHPNPVTSGGQLWSKVVMDRKLGGNAYLLKGRGFGNSTRELWRLRPDRVRILPDKDRIIGGYEYKVGNDKVVFPAEDVIHFKELAALDDYYGMSPLEPIYPRISIDNYMRTFLKTFFEQGGSGPASILTLAGEMDAEVKDEIRDRMRRQFSGSSGWHEMLILDNTTSSYSQLGLDRGLRDALPKELNSINEARIAMPFGIPGSILGLLIGYESSSYANKRADWQVLWDITMSPLLSDIDDVLNLTLVPEFGGIDEVCFDLSDIRALQEDVDAIRDRDRKDYQVGALAWEEFRVRIGVDPEPKEGHFLLPPGQSLTPASALEPKEATTDDVQTLALNGAQIASMLELLTAVTAGTLAPETAKSMIRISFPSVDEGEIDRMVDAAVSFDPAAPAKVAEPEDEAVALIRENLVGNAIRLGVAASRGRPALLADPEARAVYERCEALRRDRPDMTMAAIAARFGIAERTYRRYRSEFG